MVRTITILSDLHARTLRPRNKSTPDPMIKSNKTWPVCILLLAPCACSDSAKLSDENAKGTDALQQPVDERYTTAEDAALVEWARTATDQEITDWFTGMRRNPLPADYVVPGWIRNSSDKRSLQSNYDARYGELRGRMGADQRIEACRQDPLMVRQFIFDSNAMTSVSRTLGNGPTSSDRRSHGQDLQRGGATNATNSTSVAGGGQKP